MADLVGHVDVDHDSYMATYDASEDGPRRATLHGFKTASGDIALQLVPTACRLPVRVSAWIGLHPSTYGTRAPELTRVAILAESPDVSSIRAVWAKNLTGCIVTDATRYDTAHEYGVHMKLEGVVMFPGESESKGHAVSVEGDLIWTLEDQLPLPRDVCVASDLVREGK